MSRKSWDIKVKTIAPENNKTIEIQCHQVDDDVKEIVTFLKNRQGQLTGLIEGRQFEISISDIFYIETVDNRVFICCKNQVYESKQKLYELEEILQNKQFLRVSKSVLLNLMKVKSIKPAMNGRFLARLMNEEEIIISRKYVPILKETIKGGGKNER